MYGAPYDLLAAALGVRDDRLRGIVARWRRAGYAATGRLGPGSAWCWLTRAGLQVTGLRYAPSRPALARLAHIRAVLAIRLSLQDSDAYAQGRAWWRSERRIRAAIAGRSGTTHMPHAEVSWPDATGLLDRLPMLGEELGETLPRLAAQLYQAFDLQPLYNKHDHQVTIRAVITPTTPAAFAKLIAGSETPDAPLPAAISAPARRDPVSDSVRHPQD